MNATEKQLSGLRPGSPPNGAGWAKGQSGNPKGRKCKPITEIMRELGEGGGNEEIAARLYQIALKGDLGAIREWLDRTEGKVADKLQLTGTLLVATPEQLDLAIKLLLADRERERAIAEPSLKLIPEHNEP